MMNRRALLAAVALVGAVGVGGHPVEVIFVPAGDGRQLFPLQVAEIAQYLEGPLVTAGSDLSVIEPLLRGGTNHYTAADVVCELPGQPRGGATP